MSDNQVSATLPADNASALALFGGAEQVRGTVFSRIRTRSQAYSPEEVSSWFAFDNPNLFGEIKRGEVVPNASMDDVMSLLAAFEITIESVLPLYPPIDQARAKVWSGRMKTVGAGPLASCQLDAESEPDGDVDFFVRLQALKELFPTKDPA